MLIPPWHKTPNLLDMVASLDLLDLQSADPAPSTFLGLPDQRIDYMFGCRRTHSSMTRQGSLSYFEGPQSDHRGLYVDLDMKALFGSEIEDPRLAPAAHRPLRSGNPELVRSYIDNMRVYYERHRMKERIDSLYADHSSMSPSQARRLLEAWDNDQGRAMAAAESALKIKPKQYKWSPRLPKRGRYLPLLATSPSRTFKQRGLLVYLSPVGTTNTRLQC